MLRPAAAGRLIVLLFATLTAAKEVVAGSLARNFNVLLVVLVAFVTTTVVFHGARRLQARRASRVVLSDRLREVVWLNISTVGAWGTIFYALQYIAPAIASALAVAALPLFTLALQRSIAAEDSIYRCDIVASIAIGLSICFLAWQSYNAPLIARTATGGQLLLSIAACLVCALGLAASNLIARRLYNAGWQPTDVMAHRFYLLVVIAAALLFSRDGDLGDGVGQQAALLVAFSLIAIAMPVFILQYGLKLAAPIEAASIIAVSPIMVVAFQFLDPQVGFNPVTSAGVLATVVIVVAYLIARDRAQARERQTNADTGTKAVSHAKGA